MNKFSSLSTSVLLALLTSSVAAAAYANGTENLSSRNTTRTIADSSDDKHNSSSDALNNRDPDKDSHPLINSADSDKISSTGPISMSRSEHRLKLSGLTYNLDPHESDVQSLANAQAAPRSATSDAVAADAKSVLKDNKAQAHVNANDQANHEASASIPSALDEHDDKASVSEQIEQSITAAQSQDLSSELQAKSFVGDKSHSKGLAQGLSAANNLKGSTGSVFEGHADPLPDELIISFDHPHEFQESFIQAGDATVISYSAADSNLLISFKLTPISEGMDFAKFKQSLTKRFTDKDKMLFGEYEIINECQGVNEADEAAQGKQDLAQGVADKDAMELTLRAYLKKGDDGILPDMQNFFYERNILSNNYLATLTCEVQGRQANVAIVRNQFESLSPLCERILNSYRFSFVKPQEEHGAPPAHN